LSLAAFEVEEAGEIWKLPGGCCGIFGRVSGVEQWQRQHLGGIACDSFFFFFFKLKE
jgi:hypothetical protein